MFRTETTSVILASGEANSASSKLIEMRLVAVRFGARDTNLYEFVSIHGEALPATEPGAHIDVHLPNGLIRQYSLIESDSRPISYIIGVKRDPKSRGGSSFLHENLRVGSTLKVGGPRNNFPLAKDAVHTVLIAGGIGITPIWCMWQELRSRGKSVRLIYACRSRSDALFLSQIAADDRVLLSLDDENAGGFLDITNVLKDVPAQSHLFCCGPAPMLEAFRVATVHWPAEHVHVEHFTPQAKAAVEGGFAVELARSGREVQVLPGQTVLAALTAAGISAPYSCEEGICGACMTTVLNGIPDHRDSVLTELERQSNKTMMICCSGSKTDRLVLDL